MHSLNIATKALRKMRIPILPIDYRKRTPNIRMPPEVPPTSGLHICAEAQNESSSLSDSDSSYSLPYDDNLLHGKAVNAP